MSQKTPEKMFVSHRGRKGEEVYVAKSDPGVIAQGGGGKEMKSLKQTGRSKSSKNMKNKPLLKKNTSQNNMQKILKKDPAVSDARQKMLKEIKEKQKEIVKGDSSPRGEGSGESSSGRGGVKAVPKPSGGFLKTPTGLRIMRENRSRSLGSDEDGAPPSPASSSSPIPNSPSLELRTPEKAASSPKTPRPHANMMDREALQAFLAQSLLEANGGADSDNKDLKGSSDNKELKCSPDSKKDKDPSKDKLKVKKEKKVAAGSAVRVTTDRKIATHQEAEDDLERVRKGSVYQFSKSLGVSLPRSKVSESSHLPPLIADADGYVLERLVRSSSSPSSSSSSSSSFSAAFSPSFGSSGSTPPSSPAASSLSASSFSSTGSVFLIDQDRYTPYYRHYFYQKDHANYLTYDLEGNPIFISIEKPPCLDPALPPMPRRGFVRTCTPWTEDVEADTWVIITSEDARAKKALSKELIELVGPKAKFHELPPEASEERFLKLEDALLMKAYKFGVLHCRKNQSTEEAIFNNTKLTPDFTEFLDFLGETVVLKGFSKFRGGLDVNNNTTGEKSVFTSLSNYDIMFHVGPMLPAGEDEVQQLGRKRHIGNDIVVIIFLDSDKEEALDPSIFVSDFNHVFCVVRKMSKKAMEKLGEEEGWEEDWVAGKTYYQIGFCSKNGIHSTEPTLSYPGIYEKNEKLKRLFLTKALNSERSALYAQKFVSRLSMVRKELFKDLANDMLKLTQKKGNKWPAFKKS